ncbi:MAG: AAA family ATPase [Bacteriovoracaceae bacterium]
MFLRINNILKSHSFFLFGARGTGKSTFLKEHFKDKKILYIDLLEDRFERRYFKDPDLLFSDVVAEKKNIDFVVLDEIQKIPKLLDIVHKLMVEEKVNFALTGSSARKLKRDGANLLAGRAFLYHLYPLTLFELKERFSLIEVLSYGSLPQLYSYEDHESKKSFLTSYVKTYLKEEIILEQIIRNVDGFRDFLEVAAQMNGRPLNFLKIAREIGIDAKTIKEYFQILEDTLVGFWLKGFHQSVRKSQKFTPKFYLFDVGVCRALEGSLDSPPIPGTAFFGHYFEHYIIAEIFRLNTYSGKDFKLSYYATNAGEIDLILSKGMKKIIVEIKSEKKIDPTEVKNFKRMAEPFKNSPLYYVSQDPIKSTIEGVFCLHFRDFFQEIFYHLRST